MESRNNAFLSFFLTWLLLQLSKDNVAHGSRIHKVRHRLVEEITETQGDVGHSYICNLDAAVVRQLCLDALDSDYCQTHGYILLRGDVDSVKAYRIRNTCSSCVLSFGGSTVMACKCPTDPPIYLMDGSSQTQALFITVKQ